MKRRTFIAILSGTAAAWPLAAQAQSKNNLVIGFLSPTSPDLYQRPLAAFRDGLREAGFVEGQNVQIEYRWANGHYDRLAALATELVNLNVAVIYASGGDSSAVAAKQSTSTIPVVVSPSSDPVKMGLVASLSHPGGNITGVSRLNIELFPKRLELLREAVPNASKIAVLVNAANPNSVAVLRELESETHTFGSKFEVLRASTVSEIDDAFAAMVSKKVEALIISPDTFFNGRSEQLGSLALRNRVPAIYQLREFVAAGGLMSLGANLDNAIHKAGVYVGKILNGARPADLPVEQQSKLDFMFNLKTAKALGIETPTSLLIRADEVIE